MRAAGRNTFVWGSLGLGLLALLPLFYAWITGAASIPHNDDWAFLRVLFHLVENGELKLVGWGEMVLVGHLVWAYPLVKLVGERIVFLDTAVALISAAGIVLTARLARSFVAPPYAIGIGVLLAIFPGYVQTTVSYMTDPVAFVAQVVCLLIGLAGIDRDDRKGQTLVALSLVVGLFGFTIREFAVVAPIAVGVGAVAAGIRRHRVDPRTIMSLGLFALAAAAIYVLRQGLPGGSSHLFETPGAQRVVVLTAQSLFTVGLGVSPVLVLLARTKPDLLLRCLNIGAVAGLGLAILSLQRSGDIATCCLGSHPSVFVGNTLLERGVLGNAVVAGDRPVLIPYPYWVVLSALGVAGGSMILGWAWSSFVRWLNRGAEMLPRELTLLTWGLVTGIAIVWRAALGGPLFDRYVTVPVVVVAIFALQAAPNRHRFKDLAGPVAVVALLAFTSALLVTSWLSFDLARWNAARTAVDEGTPASAIDAGIEWVGYHYEGIAEEKRPAVTNRIGPGYFDKFPDAGNCVIVAASSLGDAGLTFLRTVPYEVWFGLRTFELWVYRYEPACATLGLD